MDFNHFLNNAKSLLMITNDQWTKGFVTSLIEQVSSGRTLSEKQISIFNAKLEAALNPLEPASLLDSEFNFKLEELRKRAKSEWLLGFLNSIENQMKSGRPLTEKQKNVFNSRYDTLVLKIKVIKEPEWEDFIDQDNF